VAGFGALQALSRRRPEHLVAAVGDGAYGPLRKAGPELALPSGFEYHRFSITGTRMSDGLPTPGMHDGMAAFPLPNGNIRLIRNHEIWLGSPNAPLAQPAYDPRAGGGTTSVELDAESLAIVNEYVSLSGTVLNCAGGPTPWGSWLSCEETAAGPGQGADRKHGYVFEVPVSAVGPVDPVPLRAMGRFVHEAVAVDPNTGIVYQTEDTPRAGFYRFLPERPHTSDRPADLAAGGRLEMLAIRDRPQARLGTGQTPGVALQVQWVEIADPDPTNATSDWSAVFKQGWREGGAQFTRVEGCWFGEGAVWFTCTSGGDAEQGQVWRYVPASDGGELTLVFESPSGRVLNHPDNVCVSPRGGIVLCEDSDRRPFVRGLTPDGKLFDFAENLESDSEFAGATFSPDGRTLFVNIQNEPGATFAIRGPWEQGAL
jgi:secreted PhoX family phosphatase